MASVEQDSNLQPRHPPHEGAGAPRSHTQALELALQVWPLLMLHAMQLPLLPQAALFCGHTHVCEDAEQLAPLAHAVQVVPQPLSLNGHLQTPLAQVSAPVQT